LTIHNAELIEKTNSELMSLDELKKAVPRKHVEFDVD
jgi:hypothetical protein